MKTVLNVTRYAIVFLVVSAGSLHAADAVFTDNGAWSWTNTQVWASGSVPQPGDTATFNAANGGTVTIPNGHPFSLSALFFNTDNASRTWTLSGETNTLTAPAFIGISNGVVRINTNSGLAGTNGFTLAGTRGNIEMQGLNTQLTGTVTVLSGRVLPRYDASLGAIPDAPTPDAIVLDGGMLGNLDTPLTIHANRGITAGPGGAYLHARNTVAGISALTIDSKITGPGPVIIIRQTDDVMFRNSANDYTGDTILGANMPIGYYTNPGGTTTLTLGADDVIPDGTGKGSLIFTPNMNGVLDLNGHSETVNALVATNIIFALANSDPANPGTLHAGAGTTEDISLFGTISAGATLHHAAAGTLRFTDAASPVADASSGRLSVSAATLVFSDPWHLGAITLALDGGNLAMSTLQPGLAEYRSSISSSQVNTNATFTFTGVFPTPRMATAPVSGFSNNTQYLYEGEWNIPADSTYSFGKAFDDGAALIIDGETILLNNSSSTVAITNGIFLRAGWRSIKLYVSQGGGGVGPNNGFPSALLYDPNDGPITNGSGGIAANARAFSDPGDGSVLRTHAPDTATSRARLEVNADAAFDRSAMSAVPITWAADFVTDPGATLTVTGSTEPITVGSPDRPALFSANVTGAAIRFQDKVWLKEPLGGRTLVGTPDLAAGSPGVLGTGPQALSAYSLRLPASDSLGDPTLAPVTVNSGLTLTFDSTAERGNVLVDDPAHAFTASNAVTLAGGTLAFEGAGTVTLASFVTGSGALHKTGPGTAVLVTPCDFIGSVTVTDGTLVVLDDDALGDSANAVTVTGGTLDLSALSSSSRTITVGPEANLILPDGPFTLTGPLSGTYTKTGASQLILGGNTPTPGLDLYVTEGSVTLNRDPGPAVRHILGVDPGASVILARSGQIAGNVTLTGGAFDLAGHSETVASLVSTAFSSVTNSSATPVTLTVSGTQDGNFVGDFSPNVTLAKNGAATQALAVFPGQPALAAAAVNDGTLALGLGARFVRFTVTKTRGGGVPIVSEFVLTRNGRPIPYPPAVTMGDGSSSQGENTTAKVIDHDARTCWQANGTGTEWFTISLSEPVIFDGYTWYTGPRNIGGNGNDPVSWTVAVSANNRNWYTIDTRTDAVPYSGNRSVKAGDFAIAPSAWPNAVLDPIAAVSIAANGTLQSRLPDGAFGSLSGLGTLNLLDGANMTVANVTGFTGPLVGAGTFHISTDTALNVPAAAAVNIKAKHYAGEVIHLPTAFPVIRNASATLASAVIGQNGETDFTGRVTDGPFAPTGLTKLGTGTTRIFDAGSDYTGDTRIAAGTLAIRPGTWNFRYIRYNVTAAKNDGVDPNKFEMAYGEFQLLLNGNPVPWPAGTTATAPVTGTHSGGDDVPSKAIDGNLNNRWLSSVLQELVIDTRTGVTFDAYRVYASGVNNADPDRAPKTWIVQGRNDGTDWVDIDTQTNVPTPAFTANQGQPIGTFQLRTSPRVPFPTVYRAETSSTNLHITAVSAQRLAFTVLANRNEDTSAEFGQSGFQFAELQLLRNGAVIPWPAGTTAWSPGGSYINENGNTVFPVGRIIDNDTSTGADNRFYSDSAINPIAINAQSNLIFDAYQWITAHNTYGRDPVSWRLTVYEGNNHYILDERFNEPVTTDRGAVIGPFPIRLPAGMLASDAIPDASRTTIAAGATFELDGDALETVGPLSGAGAVTLSGGAVLGINAFEDATFTGSVTGGGTLRLSGDSAQTFTGTLGVSNLFLTGSATLAGTATVPGSLAVTFDGGTYGATLNITGTLTASDPVAYAMPPSLPHTRTLFTFSDIDSASRDALIAGAASLDVPKGYIAKVVFTPTTATLSIITPGTILMLK